MPFLCEYVLQAGLKARSLCPRILSLAFLFRRCQLLRSLAVVLLKSASEHWKLNLAFQSKSLQAVQTRSRAPGLLPHPTLLLVLVLWVKAVLRPSLLLSWQFCLISWCCQAASEYSVLQDMEWIWASYVTRALPWLPTACSAPHPHSVGAGSLQ